MRVAQILYLLCLSLIQICICERLHTVSENELTNLFINEKNVIVLLSDTEECSGKCLKLENLLLAIREDLVEGSGSWVIQSYAPKLAESLVVATPSILFMREGRPLIYEEATDEDQLLNYLLLNQKSSVHNLTDSTFEHETQAGTGATTGDWLVMFTRTDCDECHKLQPILEKAAVNLKGRKNVAFVDREHGAVTCRRFAVRSFPTFILFRLGHLYRFTFEPKDASVLISFATEAFRNSQKEKVPMPKSPFDDLIEAIVDWIRENPWNFLGSVVGVMGFLAFVIMLNKPMPKSWAKKSKKKKN